MIKNFNLTTIDNVTFEQHMDYNQFLSQFQNFCPKLLCLLEKDNVKTLQIYEKVDQIPKDVTFVRKTAYDYYFKDTSDNGYYVFNLYAAQLFDPTLKEEQKLEEVKVKPIIIEYIHNDKYIIIYEKGKKYKFPNVPNKVEIKTLNIF
jgi:hypothetical protein